MTSRFGRAFALTIYTTFTVLGLSACVAQSEPMVAATGRAVPASMSAERLQRVDVLLQRYVDENRIAGAVALVLKDGQPVYEKAVGWSDKEAGRRMQVDSIFRIASQTKALTSVAVLQLVEEGKIALNNSVSVYIPAFAKTTVSVKSATGTRIEPATRQITIRDLLTHTAGISYGTTPDVAALYEKVGLGPAAGFGWYFADKSESMCESMEKLATVPFVAQPGDAFVYGYNTDLLGCIVEKVSGMSLDAYFRTHITEPLSMKDTQFYLPPAQRERLATVYASGNDGKIAPAAQGAKGQGHYIDGPRHSFSGGAGLLSTARDYARFLEMIRNDGTLDGQRILGPRTVDLMRTNQSGTLRSTTGLGFGYGFETVDRYGANGMDGVGAYGWGGAYASSYRVDPQSGMVLVLMLQLIPNQTDIQQTFPAAVYQALESGSR